jgi:hypothetical protein
VNCVDGTYSTRLIGVTSQVTEIFKNRDIRDANVFEPIFTKCLGFIFRHLTGRLYYAAVGGTLLFIHLHVSVIYIPCFYTAL